MNTLASPMPCTPRSGSSTHSDGANAEATVATDVSIAPANISSRRVCRSPKRASAGRARTAAMLKTARFRPMAISSAPKCSSTRRGINGICTPTYRKNTNVADVTMRNGPLTMRPVAPGASDRSGILSVCPGRPSIRQIGSRRWTSTETSSSWWAPLLITTPRTGATSP